MTAESQADLLEDARILHPTNVQLRSQLVTDIQRHHGNRHVQHLLGETVSADNRSDATIDSALNQSISPTKVQRQPSEEAPVSQPVPGLPNAIVVQVEKDIAVGTPASRQDAIDVIVAELAARGEVDRALMDKQRMFFDPALLDEGDTKSWWEDTSEGGAKPLPSTVKIGPPAFASVSWLYTTILHEARHAVQFQQLSSEPDKQAANEVDAYLTSIEAAAKTGANAAEILELWRRLRDDWWIDITDPAVIDRFQSRYDAAEAFVNSKTPSTRSPQSQGARPKKQQRIMRAPETRTEQSTATQGSTDDILIQDEDAGQSRILSKDSEEFGRDYVDNNIDSADYWSTPFANEEMRFRDFWVNYSDGRRLKFNLKDIPIRTTFTDQVPGSPRVHNRIMATPQVYIKRGGFIFPDIFDDRWTPRLIDIVTTITFNHHQREKGYEIASLTFQFAMNLAQLAAVNPEMPEMAEAEATPRIPFGKAPSMRVVSWQDLAEWEQLELAGTGGRVAKGLREGGHILERHVYITDEALQARAPTLGEKVATTFGDADTAVYAINRTLEQNAGSLDAFMGHAGTGEVDYIELTATLDRSVGHGYRALADGTVQRLDHLYQVVVGVQSDGVGGWLIRTAFPKP